MFFLVMDFVGALHSSRIVWTSSPVRKWSEGPARRAAQVAARGRAAHDVAAVCAVASVFRGVSHAHVARSDRPTNITFSL